MKASTITLVFLLIAFFSIALLRQSSNCKTRHAFELEEKICV